MPRRKNTRNELWGPLLLEAGQTAKGTFGPLRVWVRRAETDWFCASEHLDEESAELRMDPVPAAPEDLKWNRLGFERASRQVLVEPALPDRAVVVRPEMPFTILPGDRIQFFVRIPMWIQLVTADHARSVWCDLPSRVLSKTWFGSPEEGEPAYALRTTAVRSLADLPHDRHRIICPIRLRNQSEDILRLDRICLRVQHLAIFQGATNFWTNEAGVTYRGGDEWSRVAFGRAEPPFDAAARRLAEAREPSRGVFSLRSIATADIFS